MEPSSAEARGQRFVPQVNTVDAEISSSPMDALPTAERPPRRGAILVVEDRDDVRQGLAQLLELHGFVVVDAAGGEQALDHLRTDPRGFALMLLDLRMPGALDGSDVREQQLTTPELAKIPTVVVSAMEADGTVRAQLRADAWIEKPFRFDDLLAVVKQYVTPNG
jgi:CheY-like chemotaxis protein